MGSAGRRICCCLDRSINPHESGCPMSPGFGDVGNHTCPASRRKTPAPVNIPTMPRGLHRYQQSGDLHFLTFSCYHRLPYLKRPEAACLFESALEAVRKRYGLPVLGYVVMPEHVNMLVTEPKRCRLDRFIQAPGAPSKLCLGGKARSPPSLCHPSPVAGRSYPRYPSQMRSLRYSINVTLDGCCDHREMTADEDLHRNATKNLEQADALLF